MSGDKARYSKIHRRMWGDAKFRSLTAPAPNGQSLWLWLLSGEQVSLIPGLIRSGEAAMAEALKWPMKGFREAFAEALSQGMAQADWDARLIWVPNAIRYNEPQSPNVVTSWRATWEELPECTLKEEAFSHLKAFLEGMGEAFGQAFDKACRKPSSNQKQKQDQKQEQEQKTQSARACRLPEDWTPEPLTIAQLEELGMTQAEADAHLPGFRDHWTAETSAKAVKRDWQAAWRSWLRSPYRKSNGRMRTIPETPTQRMLREISDMEKTA